MPGLGADGLVSASPPYFLCLPPTPFPPPPLAPGGSRPTLRCPRPHQSPKVNPIAAPAFAPCASCALLSELGLPHRRLLPARHTTPRSRLTPCTHFDHALLPYFRHPPPLLGGAWRALARRRAASAGAELGSER